MIKKVFLYKINLYICKTKIFIMTTIKKMIKKKYGNVNKFAIAVGWSYQRAAYTAKKNPQEMNLRKLHDISRLLDCDITELI